MNEDLFYNEDCCLDSSAFVPYLNGNVLYDPQKGPRAYGYRTSHFEQEELNDDQEARATTYDKMKW